MATVKIDKFGGIAPRLHPTLLADGMAVTAHNCRLKSGKLVPLRSPSRSDTASSYLENGLDKIGNAHSIHVWRRRDGSFDFLLFPGMTWCASGNVADDSRMRVIVSGETGESFTDDSNKEWSDTPMIYLRHPETQDRDEPVTLCMNSLAAPKVSRESDDALDSSHIYSRFFYTWTDALGRESPCSKPSLIPGEAEGTWIEGELEHNDGDEIHFEAVANVPTEATAIRIWKVVTGNDDGYIQFVKELSKAAATDEGGFSFAVSDRDAGETIREIEAPPGDLRCVLDVPGSFYCGISAAYPKTVFFSDVDLIYSWPSEYRYDVRDRIVTLAVTSNTVFALTEGWPYAISGTAPESMTVSKIAGPAACVSARGVVVHKNSVYFVSNAGLMSIHNDADSGTVCTNVTDGIYTKDQWQAFNPQSCVMVQHDGALHLFFALEDGSHRGLVVDLTEPKDVAVTTHDEVAKCACVDDATDKMFFVREEEDE